MSVVCDKLTVRYGARAALAEIDLRFAPGAVTGVVGPNGAGKTTLLRAVLGLQPLDRGSVTVLGRPLAHWPREALARTMAYLPQGGEARWPMLASDVVLLGRLPHRAAFAGPRPADLKAVEDALARCDAQRFALRRMDELSAGERARVLFARALATGASILLADEPAAFLDPAHQLRLMDLLRQEARRGTAVIVTLHDLALASRHCDEIVVLHEGRLAADGGAGAALSAATLAKVFGIAAERDAAGGLASFRRI